MRTLDVTLVLAIALCACGGDDGGAAQSDAFESDCGKPGDMGNEVGVGKFCASLGECGSTAPLCSSIGDPDTHFCTRTCPMGDSSVCGTGAECTCNSSNQCGCTPSACLTN
jgi:hypothetical protein